MCLQINSLDPHIVSLGVACIATASVCRIFSTAGIAFGDRLNTKEKFFVSLSWMAKATVQAALGPVAMRNLTEDSTEEERHYAYVILTVCILSIVLTAPLGAIIISVTGSRLLTKTKQPQVTEGESRT